MAKIWKQLAIIIPAYKYTFLRQTLDSIAAQTCQDFTLYIGDDCSPYDIGSIVNEYMDKIDIVYKRFDTNLGGTDLVAQWERCIDMSQDEPYIWLFSDDDVMEPRCVESFMELDASVKDKYNLFHFNVKIIDGAGLIKKNTKPYPQKLGNYDYYKGKLRGSYVSLVVENIFKRTVYNEHNGFKSFDLAWGSDTATWVLFSENNGFYTIDDSYVRWRVSDENISPNVSSPIVERKVAALNEFFKWSYTYFKPAHKFGCFVENCRAFISRMAGFKHHINSLSLDNAIRVFCVNHGAAILKPVMKSLIILKKSHA